MSRFFIHLSYNGANYCGWQTQPNGPTVQAELERCLSALLGKQTAVTGAGRTDAGVHARRMTAHFDAHLSAEALPDLVNRLNGMLSADVAVFDIVPVRPDAHARFSAVSRTYQYHITYVKDPFRSAFHHRVRQPLDVTAMNAAAETLLEYTDFTSFSKLHTDTKTNNCRILRAEWTERDGELVFTITADRFLRNMVRAIVGTLLEVGRGKLNTDGFRQVIESKDRARAGSSAPGNALFLTEIVYEDVVI